VVDLLGRRGRPERGEVKYLILDVLREEPAHGYQIIQTIEQRTHGAYKPSPGTVYPTLQLLEEMDLVTSVKEGGRKVFELTAEGGEELDRHQDEIEHVYMRFGGSLDWADVLDFPGLARRVRRIMGALGPRVHHGRLTHDDLAEIKRVMDEAMDRIEHILRR
jgi:DNA-binding PadR family transcriptional regulator